MKILSVNDPEFRKYGKIIRGIDFSNISKVMGEMPCPDNEVVYVPSIAKMEECPEAKQIAESLYGGMPIEIGYCNGDNVMLNAVEYHRDSEINIAVTDCIMIWGNLADVTEDYTYDTSKMVAFHLPAGTAVECYATTLHYAPCNYNGNKFRVVVVLPKGTNTDLDFKVDATSEDKLLFARNKWLIGHPDAKIEGAFNGLIGKNLNVNE
ncbi:MAG: DUF4867 family protein [Lachnospiraceae bacterium]|nr:DUF4867 family protein [Lachnospiraceae bacterium]